MKRFVVKKQTPKGIVSRTFKFDDQDAYLLRSCVWTLNIDRSGYCILVRMVGGEHEHLKHIIAGAKKNEIVTHLNGDSLDYRRENLAVIRDCRRRKRASEEAA